MRSSIGFVDMAGMAGALAYDFFARHRLSQDDRIFGAALGMLLSVLVCWDLIG